MERRRLANAANMLTLSRFAAAPAMVWLILSMAAPSPDGPAWPVTLAAFALTALTLATDMVDGWVARRRRIVTDFGKIMDPVADSTFFMTVLFALTASPRFGAWFPVWIPLAVLYREVAMQVLRRYGALRGRVMAAKWSGKIKMGIQSAALLAFFLVLAGSDLAAAGGAAWAAEAAFGRGLFWVGVLIVAANVLSLAEYLKDVPGLIAEYHDDPAA